MPLFYGDGTMMTEDEEKQYISKIRAKRVRDRIKLMTGHPIGYLKQSVGNVVNSLKPRKSVVSTQTVAGMNKDGQLVAMLEKVKVAAGVGDDLWGADEDRPLLFIGVLKEYAKEDNATSEKILPLVVNANEQIICMKNSSVGVLVDYYVEMENYYRGTEFDFLDLYSFGAELKEEFGADGDAIDRSIWSKMGKAGEFVVNDEQQRKEMWSIVDRAQSLYDEKSLKSSPKL